MSNSAPVLGLEWDKDGDTLAILQEGNFKIKFEIFSVVQIISKLLTSRRGRHRSALEPFYASYNPTGDESKRPHIPCMVEDILALSDWHGERQLVDL